MIPLLLLILGWLLILSEFFLPGGVMGTAGALSVVGSIVLFSIAGYSLPMVLLFIALAIVGTVVVIKFAIWRLRKAHAAEGLSTEGDEEGYHAGGYDQALVGLQAEAVTDLKPSGHIRVNEQRVQAVSQSGYLDAGTRVEIVGGRGAYLLVRKMDTEG